MNKSAKGNYYKRKTKEWYEKEGYQVGNLEVKYKVEFIDKKTKKKKIVFVKKDLFGGDLCALKKDELIWIQCKTNLSDINKGLQELNKNPLRKGLIKFSKIVVYWPPRSREPEIWECE